MEQYLTFAGNHPFLVGAFFMLSVMLFMSYFGERFKGYSSVTPSQATQLINREDAVMLDVREDNEFAGGHIINAKHIPSGFVKDRIGELDKFKNKPVIVVCRSGHRSGQACSALKKQGFEKIFNLRGGMMAWETDKLPVTRS